MGTLAIPGQANKHRQRGMRAGGMSPTYPADTGAALLHSSMLSAPGAMYVPVAGDSSVAAAMHGMPGMPPGVTQMPPMGVMTAVRPPGIAMAGIGPANAMPGATVPISQVPSGVALGMGVSAGAAIGGTPAGVR